MVVYGRAMQKWVVSGQMQKAESQSPHLLLCMWTICKIDIPERDDWIFLTVRKDKTKLTN